MATKGKGHTQKRCTGGSRSLAPGMLVTVYEVKAKEALAGAKPISGPSLHRFREVPKPLLLEPIRKLQHPSRDKEELNSQLLWPRQCHLHMGKRCTALAGLCHGHSVYVQKRAFSA